MKTFSSWLAEDSYAANIENDTMANTDYRRVVFTGPNMQVVLMSLKPGQEIGAEVHKDHDQFIRIEAGQGKAIVDGEEKELQDGSAVLIPAGTRHNIVNTSREKPLKLYTLYSPPDHPDGTIEHEKA